MLPFAFLFLFISSPLPRPATNQKRTQAQSKNDKRQSQQEPSEHRASPIAVVQLAQRTDQKEHSEKRTAEREPKPVVVRVPTPIPVQKDDLDYVGAIGTLILAVGTLGLAFYAGLQVKALKDGERAWMVAQMENLPEEIVPRNVLRLACHIKNLGRSPALLTVKGESCRVEAAEYTLPLPLQSYENTTEWKEGGATIPPNGEIVVASYLTADKTALVYDGGKVLWVYGFVEYRDAFKRHHRTRYCFRYSPRKGGEDAFSMGFYPDGPPEYTECT